MPFKKCLGIEFLSLLTANSLECILYYKLNLQSNLNSLHIRIGAGSMRPSHKGYAENSNRFQMPHASLAFDSLVRRNGSVYIKMVFQMSQFSNNATCCDCWQVESSGILNYVFVPSLAIRLLSTPH